MTWVLRALAALAVLVAVPASAQSWHRAETQHFIVYAEDDANSTKEFAQDLERLDEVLRILTGVGPDDGSLPESTKVTVFRFGETRDMATLAGNRNSGVGGFFIGRADGAVAFVPRQLNKRRGRSRQRDVDSAMMLDPQGILFHEYVHYFMFQHSDAPYPLWYSEGFAELFSNVEFFDDYFLIGEVPTARSYSLSAIPIDLEKTFDPPAKRDRNTTGRTYAHGWLLASHLNLNPERRGQMGKYMQAIGEGKTRMEAAEIAFGDLEVLRKELEEFRQGKARVLKVPYATQAEPPVEVHKLNEAQAARMEAMIITNRGVDEDEAASVVRKTRPLVERYPQSPEVLLAATEAEIYARNYAEAEALAQRAIAADPESTEAAMFYGDIALRQSFEDPSKLSEARKRYAAANQKEFDHPYPLYGYYLSYLFDESEEMPEVAKTGLESAFRYAPFDYPIRQALVHMLLLEDRPAEAKIVGARFIDGKGGQQCMLRKMFTEFEEGKREPLLNEVRPDHPGEYKDEAQRKAEREATEKLIEEYGCKVD